MQLELELAEYGIDEDSIITIGVFDGVHLGHKYLISQVKKLAKRKNLLSVVITFKQHPQEILSPEAQPLFLTDIDEKIALLKGEGADVVICLSFTRDLAALSAREFLSFLKKHLRMKELVVGPDFVLGHNNEGNIDTLYKIGLELDFSVTKILPVTKNGDIVSSTAIRQTIAVGDMVKVQRLMGRPFSLNGLVVHGKGRGAALGFPTANLDILPGQALPPDGVYATIAYVKNTPFSSVTNVGQNPTFMDNIRTVETHLIDYQGNLYDDEVKIEFIYKLRDEIIFQNIEDLKSQIAHDTKVARTILCMHLSDTFA